MNHEIFICCCEQDIVYADAVCHFMEKNLLRCWHPYRDMPIDGDLTQIITNAIEESKVLLYILSETSNDSTEILNQINTAVNNRVDIITIRISQVQPSDKVKYYLVGSHWMDMLPITYEEQMDQIVVWMKDCIDRRKQDKQKRVLGSNLWIRVLRRILITAAVLIAGMLIFMLVYPQVRGTSKEFRHIFASNAYIDSFFLSYDGTKYAYPYENGKLDIIETETGKVITTINSSFHGKINTIFCGDGDSIIVMSGKAGSCYSLDTGQEKQHFTIDIAPTQILFSYEGRDTYIDFYYLIDNGTTEMVRYDYIKDTITMRQNMKLNTIDGVTKDGKYLVTHTFDGELHLFDYTDFSKPIITGEEAANICSNNLAENRYINFSQDGKYHVKYDFQKSIRVSIVDQEGKAVFTSNFEAPLNLWFHRSNSILVHSKDSISKIDFLTSKKTDIFSSKLLKSDKILKDQLITLLLYEDNSELVYTFLKKTQEDNNRLYVIDVDDERLVQDVDIPIQAERLTIQCNGDRVFIIYYFDSEISMDMSRLSVKNGKKYLSYVKSY